MRKVRGMFVVALSALSLTGFAQTEAPPGTHVEARQGERMEGIELGAWLL